MADNRIDRLRQYIADRNTGLFDEIIATGPNLNGNIGDDLLDAAIQTQNPHFVNGLIAAGARARPNDHGQLLTRVAFAVEGPNNAVEMARLLIDAGAAVNSNGMTQPPIFIAALYGRYYLFGYLILEKGANPAAVVHGRNVLDAIRMNDDAESKKNCAALILSLLPEIQYTSPVFEDHEPGDDGTIVPRPEHFGDTIAGFVDRVRRIYPARAALARGPAVLAYAAAARRAGGRRRKTQRRARRSRRVKQRARRTLRRRRV